MNNKRIFIRGSLETVLSDIDNLNTGDEIIYMSKASFKKSGLSNNNIKYITLRDTLELDKKTGKYNFVKDIPIGVYEYMNDYMVRLFNLESRFYLVEAPIIVCGAYVDIMHKEIKNWSEYIKGLTPFSRELDEVLKDPAYELENDEIIKGAKELYPKNVLEDNTKLHLFSYHSYKIVKVENLEGVNDNPYIFRQLPVYISADVNRLRELFGNSLNVINDAVFNDMDFKRYLFYIESENTLLNVRKDLENNLILTSSFVTKRVVG